MIFVLDKSPMYDPGQPLHMTHEVQSWTFKTLLTAYNKLHECLLTPYNAYNDVLLQCCHVAKYVYLIPFIFGRPLALVSCFGCTQFISAFLFTFRSFLLRCKHKNVLDIRRLSSIKCLNPLNFFCPKFGFRRFACPSSALVPSSAALNVAPGALPALAVAQLSLMTATAVILAVLTPVGAVAGALIAAVKRLTAWAAGQGLQLLSRRTRGNSIYSDSSSGSGSGSEFGASTSGSKGDEGKSSSSSSSRSGTHGSACSKILGESKRADSREPKSSQQKTAATASLLHTSATLSLIAVSTYVAVSASFQHRIPLIGLL